MHLGLLNLTCQILKVINMAKSNYKVTQIDGQTWIIEEKTIVSQAFIYLLEGKESALLIDTGSGFGDLKALTGSLTGKNLSVVCTHCHFDHISANYQFEDIYLHREEKEAFATYTSHEYLDDLCKRTIPWIMRFLLHGTIKKIFSPQLGGTYHYIDDGYVFDLGGRQIEVIHTPGHSPGSICLLDRGTRRLFTGDTAGNKDCMLDLDFSCPPETYLQSLRRLKKLDGIFDMILPGHHQSPKTSNHLDEFLACAEGIVDGSITLQEAKFFNRSFLKAEYGSIHISLPHKGGKT